MRTFGNYLNVIIIVCVMVLAFSWDTPLLIYFGWAVFVLTGLRLAVGMVVAFENDGIKNDIRFIEVGVYQENNKVEMKLIQLKNIEHSWDDDDGFTHVYVSGPIHKVLRLDESREHFISRLNSHKYDAIIKRNYEKPKLKC